MKNTNKAFTLIELLAVILILGIIALIAIPAVLGIPRGAWTVGSNGDLNYVYVDYSPSCGVRPVITVSKSKLS